MTIGAPESLAAFRLPEIIREFRSKFPQVKFILKPGVCWEFPDLIRSGGLDLAFLLQPENNDQDLITIILVQEKMALIAPPDHYLVNYDYVEPEDLKNETLLHTEPGCNYRELFEQQLNSRGIFPNPDL